MKASSVNSADPEQIKGALLARLGGPSRGGIIATILKMILAGEIEPVIDRTYGIDAVVAALEYCDAGNAKGKVVITID